MKTCRMNGSDALAVAPSETLLVGMRAPAQHALAFLGHDVAKNPFAFRALSGIVRQEHHADAVFAGARQGNFLLRRDFLEKGVRRLNQDARAVAGVDLTAARAAVIQVEQHLQRLPDNRVGFLPLHVDHETHAAGLVFKLRDRKVLVSAGQQAAPAGKY